MRFTSIAATLRPKGKTFRLLGCSSGGKVSMYDLLSSDPSSSIEIPLELY